MESLSTYCLDPVGDFALFDVPLEWKNIVSSVPSQNVSRPPPVILVCGPRKVGKSTFGRFLVNNLLNSHPKVCYADLDCGQTEFMPPGFLSLKVVTEPLLGKLLSSVFNGPRPSIKEFNAARAC